MANGVAVFALLCSIAAVVFGVWRYRQVRAATRAAAQDRMDAWRAEMAVFEAQAAQAASQDEDEDEAAAGAQSDPSAVAPTIEVAAEAAPDAEEEVEEGVESDALAAPVVSDEQAPVDVRAEMDAFFGSAPAVHRPENGESDSAPA